MPDSDEQIFRFSEYPVLGEAKFFLSGYDLSITGRYPALALGMDVRLEGVDYKVIKVALVVSDNRTYAYFRYDLVSGDDMSRVVAGTSNTNHNAGSLFDSFTEFIRGGVIVYTHKSCRTQVPVNIAEINVGEKLRILIKHYDECIRQPKR